jgi:hypothetical protein
MTTIYTPSAIAVTFGLPHSRVKYTSRSIVNYTNLNQRNTTAINLPLPDMISGVEAQKLSSYAFC